MEKDSVDNQTTEATEAVSYRGEHRRLAAASRYAAVVVGNILGSWIEFSSVLDLGCGNGAWLRGLADGGRRSVFGIEPEAQDRDDLQIDADLILQSDLARPLDLHRRFDLALCLEVAEHIDAAGADTVVANCVRHADLVLFSAAIPGQGGIHHVNEQLPEYWAGKFATHGYVARDLIRPLIWNDQQIPVWYRQNLLIFARQDAPHLAGLLARNTPPDEMPLGRAHPDLLAWLSHRVAEEIAATEELRRTLARAREEEVNRVRVEAAAAKTRLERDLTDALSSYRGEQQARQNAEREYQAATRELTFASHTVATLRREREIIFSSTIWQATAPLRLIGRATPEGVRKAMRAILRVGLRILPASQPPRPAGGNPRLATPLPTPPQIAEPGTLPRQMAGHRGIVVVSGEPHIPGHIYRAERLADAFGAPCFAGLSARCLGLTEAAAAPEVLRQASLVVLWRAVGGAETSAVIAAVREGGAKLAYDIDDLMFAPDLATTDVIDGIRTQNLDEAETADYFRRVRSVIEQVDLCVCATEELAHHVRGMRIPAFVLPNGFDAATLDAARLAARRRAASPGDGLIRIGYAAGTRTHQRDFAVAAPALARILAQHPACRLVLFREADSAVPLLDAAEFPDLVSYAGQIEWRAKVGLAELPAEMARFDINIAPLEVGNPFCEAKSELKFYEAALAGAVSIVSPTGPMARLVRNGETGFLADIPDAWFESLNALIADPALRARLAAAALRDVLWSRGPERRVELAQALADQAEGGMRAARAFELELRRRTDPVPEFDIPEAETVFVADQLGTAAVTVVVPLYNYAHYLTEALDSVAAQTLHSLDLIVVDDASTDHSLAVAADWARAHAGRFNRIVVMRNTVNSGLARTRNTGFNAAETRTVLPLDADNRLRPTCLTMLLAAMDRAGSAFAYSTLQCFGGSDHIIGDLPFSPARFVAGNYIDAMAVVAKSAWAALGGYAHIRFGWEDYDFWCRLVARGMFGVHVPTILAEYRFHEASMLRTTTDVAGNKQRVVAQMEKRHPWLAIQDRM